MSTLTNEIWLALLEELRLVIGDDAILYKDKITSKLVAAITFIADSEDPERFAISNLLTLYAAVKSKKIFNHRTTDDIDLFRRLATFKYGKNSRQSAIQYGMALLAKIMICDYEHDREQDKIQGKYNPLNEGSWTMDGQSIKIDTILEANRQEAVAYSEYAASLPYWWS